MKPLATLTATIALVLGLGLTPKAQAQEQFAAKLKPGVNPDGSGIVAVAKVEGVGNVLPSHNIWGIEVENLLPSTNYQLLRRDDEAACEGAFIGEFMTDPVGAGSATFRNPSSVEVNDEVDVCQGIDGAQVLTGTLKPAPNVIR